MPANRFEQVDEPQADAITLSLTERGGEAFGRVLCPADLAAGGQVAHKITELPLSLWRAEEFRDLPG